MDAYLTGLEDRILAKESIKSIHSVASFFISRLDTIIETNSHRFTFARQIAIAKPNLLIKPSRSHQRVRFNHCTGARQHQAGLGIHQTKNPAIQTRFTWDELIGPGTVKPSHEGLSQAFKDHGYSRTNSDSQCGCRPSSDCGFGKTGISLDKATQDLEDAGVKPLQMPLPIC